MSALEPETTRFEQQEQADRDAISAAEQLVLRVLERNHPSSLQDLREQLAAIDAGGVDPRLFRVAIWRLLNREQVSLTDDRRLDLAAG